MKLLHSDKLIAKRLMRGDERAFREVFDDFFPKLYRYAIARVDGNADEATEIVQQTFCRAFERIDSYRGEASLYGWMCSICRNALIDRARRQQREYRNLAFHEAEEIIHEIAEVMCAPTADQPENAAARGNLQQLIQATLDHLPAHYGDVLEWKYIEGLTVDEIAERLTVGSKAAESMLTRARQAFRKAIASIREFGDCLPADIVAAVKD